MDPADNLNLIQPVNPWVGDSWEIYNEYFQWSPTNNKNSGSHTVQPASPCFLKCTPGMLIGVALLYLVGDATLLGSLYLYKATTSERATTTRPVTHARTAD